MTHVRIRIRSALLSFALLAFAAAAPSAVRASLAIKPSDIHNGKYLYKLDHGDMKTAVPSSGKLPDWEWIPSGNKLLDDCFSFSNIRVTGANWSFVWLKQGTTRGEIVYKFDFSRTGHAATAFRVREVVRREADGPAHDKRSSCGFRSFYRIGDEGEWKPLNELAPSPDFKGDTLLATLPVKLDAPSPVVYYRVVLTSSQPLVGSYLGKGQKGHQDFGRAGVLWNFTRIDNAENFFQILFDVTGQK
ncbi:MAG: hypothetical protein LBK99_04975 [Opitutaceae bacterium]|jgi:hypothetical protein|nr:hypothetical protein [Opitutaceae bacterium]